LSVAVDAVDLVLEVHAGTVSSHGFLVGKLWSFVGKNGDNLLFPTYGATDRT